MACRDASDEAAGGGGWGDGGQSLKGLAVILWDLFFILKVMASHWGRFPNMLEAHGIIRNNQMFPVSSFLLIISGGKKLLDGAKDPSRV